MAISFTEIQQTLDTQLRTVTDLPTHFIENLPSGQRANTKWVRSTLLPARSEVITLGTSFQEQGLGLYQVDLFYPKDRGFSTASAMADAVIAAFVPGAIHAGTEHDVRIRESWRLAGNEFQTFYCVSVQVEWMVFA